MKHSNRQTKPTKDSSKATRAIWEPDRPLGKLVQLIARQIAVDAVREQLGGPDGTGSSSENRRR